jgi:hypothetical protein
MTVAQVAAQKEPIQLDVQKLRAKEVVVRPMDAKGALHGRAIADQRTTVLCPVPPRTRSYFKDD